MSYSAEDYAQLWSAMILQDLRERNIGLQLTSQMFTLPWVQGDSKVIINDPKYLPSATSDSATEGVMVVDRARGANWPTPRKGDSGILEFTRTGGWGVANEISWEDLNELRFGAAEGTRLAQVEAINNKINSEALDVVQANVAAAQTADLGAVGDTISISAPYQSTGDIGELFIDALEAYIAELDLDNVYSSNSQGDLGNIWCLVSPPVFLIVRRYLRANKLSWDKLTQELLERVSLLATGNFKGRLFGIDIVSTNDASMIPATAAGKWPVYLGLKNQTIANVRPALTQVLDPQSNQISDYPAWLARSVGEYIAFSIPKFSSLGRKYEIRAAA